MLAIKTDRQNKLADQRENGKSEQSRRSDPPWSLARSRHGLVTAQLTPLFTGMFRKSGERFVWGANGHAVHG